MQAIIEPALTLIFKHEGGLNNVPGDIGGWTHWGVSLRFLRTLLDEDGDGWLDGDMDHDGDVDADDIKQMTREDAIRIYDLQWWQRYHYNLINATHQSIANKVMDLCVNMGPRRRDKNDGTIWGAHVIVQRAINMVRPGKLVEDGYLGSKSFAAINESNQHALLIDFRLCALDTYHALVKANPKLRKFLKGWRRRAVSI